MYGMASLTKKFIGVPLIGGKFIPQKQNPGYASGFRMITLLVKLPQQATCHNVMG